jgi:nicotinate-nucleotide pyrophosphorylase (carboxylating)
MNILAKSMAADYARFYAEDDLSGNAFYLKNLPTENVTCNLKIKSNLILAGLPYFVGAFNYLGSNLSINEFEKYEGQHFSAGENISFTLPFNIALSGERVALNLLQRTSAIATFTNNFVKRAAPENIKILDTRKTTPGLRIVEKYAVRIGGGFNHRFSQADAWMIKDNHKNYFGGLKPALNFFRAMQTFYQPIIVEIHSLAEFKEAIELKVKHVMLDNFSADQIQEAIKIKPNDLSIEISGGVNLSNIDNFLIPGVDAISIGALTHSAPHVDLSLKFSKTGQR